VINFQPTAEGTAAITGDFVLVQALKVALEQTNSRR
jgi:hypothetical protein